MAELTTVVPLGGRDVEMRKPTDGALAVLARAFRGIPKIENVAEITDEQRDRVIRNLGILGEVVDSMIVQEADKDWLDDVMISGKVSPEDVFAAITVAGQKFNGTATKKTAAPVRRRR